MVHPYLSAGLSRSRLRREGPAKELLSRYFFVEGPVAVTELGIVPIAAEEVLQGPVDEETAVIAIVVLLVKRQIPAVFVHGPAAGGNRVVVPIKRIPGKMNWRSLLSLFAAFIQT